MVRQFRNGTINKLWFIVWWQCSIVSFLIIGFKFPIKRRYRQLMQLLENLNKLNNLKLIRVMKSQRA